MALFGVGILTMEKHIISRYPICSYRWVIRHQCHVFFACQSTKPTWTWTNWYIDGKKTSRQKTQRGQSNNLFPRMPGAGLCCIAVLRGRMVMAEHRHLRDIREKPETVGLGAVSAVSAEVRAATRSDVAARASSYGGVVTVVRCSTHKSKQFVEKNKLHYDLWNLPEATQNLPSAKVGSMPPGKNNKSSKSAKSRATRSSRVERVIRVKAIRAVRAIGRSINTKGSKTSCTRFGQCFQEKSGTKTPVRLFGGAFSCWLHASLTLRSCLHRRRACAAQSSQALARRPPNLELQRENFRSNDFFNVISFIPGIFFAKFHEHTLSCRFHPPFTACWGDPAHA